MNLHSEQPASGEPLPQVQAEFIAASALPKRIPLPVFSSFYASFELVVIAFATAFAGLAYYAWAFPGTSATFATHLQLGALIAFFVVAASILQGSYRPDRLQLIGARPEELALSVVFGLTALIIILFAAKRSISFSRAVIFVSIPLLFCTLLALRSGMSCLLNRLARRNLIGLPRIMLVGLRSFMNDMLDEQRNRHAYSIAGMHEVSATPGTDGFEEEISLACDFAKRLDAGIVVICVPWSDGKTIRACAERLSVLPSAIYLAVDRGLLKIDGWPFTPDFGALGQLISRRPLTQAQLALKRGFDLVSAGAGLLVLAPVLIGIALLIKLDSPGPVLFRQRRYGYNRIPFRVYKFRTMTVESSGEGFRQATRNDKRVTGVGRVLRRLSLDELPQLFNVLEGTMSLVGPRPHPVELDEQFAPLIQHYATRHKIKPGITGWAQVKGHRGETRSTATMADRVAHDLHYLNHWSFWLDIKILLMTVTSLTLHKNAV